MKKLLTSVLLIVMLVMVVAPFVNASSETLADDLYAKLSAYGMTSADKVKVERYLADNEVTDEQASAILAKADEAIAIMDAEGTKDVRELSADAKAKIKAIAQETASTIGLTLVFTSGTVEVYKDGELIDTVTLSNSGKLAYTGNNINVLLVVASVAVIALATTVVVRKRMAIGA
mgnify:CR=1 FL=1